MVAPGSRRAERNKAQRRADVAETRTIARGGAGARLEPPSVMPSVQPLPSNDDSNCTDYVLLVPPGFERVAIPAISSLLGVAVQRVLHPSPTEQWCLPTPNPPDAVFPGDAAVLKLHVSLPTPSDRAGWAAQHALLASVPCTQGVLAPLAFVSGVAPDVTGLHQIEAVVRALPESSWRAAMHTWRHLRAGGVACEASASEAPCFRASALRDGKHKYDSVLIAESVGAAVFATRGLAVSLELYDLEIVAILCAGQMLLALNTWPGRKRQFRGRLGCEPRPLLPFSETPASLRPSCAWLMLQLAHVGPGDVVCA